MVRPQAENAFNVSLLTPGITFVEDTLVFVVVIYLKYNQAYTVRYRGRF